MKKLKLIALSALLLGGGAILAAESAPTTMPATRPTSVPPVLSFTMKSLAGKEVNLADYKGKVLLIVNTASHCGNTPQYAPLEKLYEKYTDKGFAILGFPCNDFGAQEPGTAEEITEFCTANYGVKFPMFAKIEVKGEEQAPLYKLLIKQTGGAPISWNFEKFLITREGKIADRWDPKKQPDAPDVVKAIETEIAK